MRLAWNRPILAGAALALSCWVGAGVHTVQTVEPGAGDRPRRGEEEPTKGVVGLLMYVMLQ